MLMISMAVAVDTRGRGSLVEIVNTGKLNERKPKNNRRRGSGSCTPTDRNISIQCLMTVANGKRT
jgi:hypothetical protein